MEVDGEAVRRLAEILAALPFSPFTGDNRSVGVAVSGGPDSLALLLLMHHALPDRVEAASVDHGLRLESASEAQMVAELCAQLGIPHQILTVTVDKGGAGVQANARAARYDALAKWAGERALCAVATAHHADDQAETLLMRANRGAGLRGLAGIRPVTLWRDKMTLIRPLLGWKQADLIKIVYQAGLKPADDPSNRDAAYDRSRMRALIAREPELDRDRLAKSAAALQDADTALNWAAEQLVATRIVEESGCLFINSDDIPQWFQRYMVEYAVQHFMPESAPLRGDEIDIVLSALLTNGKATLRGIAFAGGDRWTVQIAPPRRH